MIERLLVCRAGGTDPYENLALEEALLNRVGEGELILYLWQNERTVVIGKNQNPWKECRTALLAEEGGHLARRLSGGGAVFHDLGNLNFTFLMPAQDYDLPRQLTVIQRACRSLGIPAERSGRNDLLADGRKFSGNAFYKHNGKAYHHGTLMVDVDLDRVQRYLSPSKAKLAAKGVESVRSRVVNLREFVPTLTVEQLADALIAALAEVYSEGTGNREQGTGDRQQATGNETPVGAVIDRPPIRENLPDLSLRDQSADWSWQSVSPGPVQMLNVDDPDLLSLTEKYASDAWLYGPKLPFTLSVEDRFPWGGIELQLNVNEGVIQTAKVYTDAMDETLAERLERRLIGSAFRGEALEERLQGAALPDRQAADLRSLLRKAL
ncbi:MAG: lipoate--protein ligase [Oscillospiraceae bacterium]|nr:lipoate--protein ligase [Oscillospiraceae bacterium]